MVESVFASLTALVAVSNVLPILPVIEEVTADLPPQEQVPYRLTALWQANAAAVAFMLGAPTLFGVLSLTVQDLRVAGGVILLAYATHDILFSRAKRKDRQADADADAGPAIAPLGMPIMVGPATLCLLLLLAQEHGRPATLIAVLVNRIRGEADSPAGPTGSVSRSRAERSGVHSSFGRGAASALWPDIAA